MSHHAAGAAADHRKDGEGNCSGLPVTGEGMEAPHADGFLKNFYQRRIREREIHLGIKEEIFFFKIRRF